MLLEKEAALTMLPWKAWGRKRGPEGPPTYLKKSMRWRYLFAAALLVSMVVAMVSGKYRNETWRGVETAALFALPWWTWSQYKAYSRSAVDMSALEANTLCKRWLLENLLSMLHALLIMFEVVGVIVNAVRGGEVDNGLTVLFLLIDFAVVVSDRA